VILKNLKSLVRYRELIGNIVLRDIKSRYSHSFLGIFWVILYPVALMVIFTIVFSKLMRFSAENTPYPLFVLSGLLAWNFFANSVNGSISSLLKSANLIKKIYFPREVFCIATVITASIDLFIGAAVFSILLIAYDMALSTKMMAMTLVFLVQITFTIGVSLFLSAINVFYRDVAPIVQIIMMPWMFLTPVVYPASLIPEEIRSLYMLNPMASIIESYRIILFYSEFPDLFHLLYSMAVAVIVFTFSYLYFKRSENQFADIV
jgi:ABC-type polysaccharide/polyol phosphate export permease